MAYFVGIAQFKWLDKCYDSAFSVTRITRWEKANLCQGLQRNTRYITVATATGIHVTIPDSQEEQQQPTSRAFSGKGIVIGGSDLFSTQTSLLRNEEQDHSQKGYNHFEIQTEISRAETDVESQSSRKN
mmetsp:Transcript_21456/g.24928  ORF Transcript_21456/g.24928 Transcript_21456/m.24928 type:complete len:129 (-) Transcript_21456:21-407(-)